MLGDRFVYATHTTHMTHMTYKDIRASEATLAYLGVPLGEAGSNEQRQQTGNQHDAGDDRQGATVASCDLPNARNQQRPEHARKTPRSKHEAVN